MTIIKKRGDSENVFAAIEPSKFKITMYEVMKRRINDHYKKERRFRERICCYLNLPNSKSLCMK